MAKYSFDGISKLGAAGVRAALLSSPSTAWIKGPFVDLFIYLFVRAAANKGLILLNIGAIYVEGELDQNAMDKAMDKAFSELENKAQLSDSKKESIDNEVIKAARRFILFSNTP